MTIKKKFSHLGFSIIFYLVCSNLVSIFTVTIATIIYTVVNYLRLSSNYGSPSDPIDTRLVYGILSDFRANTTLTTLITMCSGYFIAIPLTLLILNLPKYRDLPLRGMQFYIPQEKSIKRKLSPGEFVNFLMFMFPLGIIGSLIGNILAVAMSLITGQTMSDVLTSTLSNLSLPMVFVLSVILAPIFEEILFRYSVIGYCRRWGEWNAIVVSALIFGLIHTNVFQFFYAFALGIVFGYVYVYTGKLIYTIIMHVTFNFFGAFFPMLIDPTLSADNMGIMIYSVAEYVIAIIGLIMLFIYIQKGNLMKTSPQAPIQGKLHKDSLLNPGMIFLIVICLILTVVFAFTSL